MLSTLDRYWKKNLSLDEGIDIINKCIAEIQKRMVISNPRFCIKAVSKDGVSVIKSAVGDSTASKEDVPMESATTAPAPVSA